MNRIAVVILNWNGKSFLEKFIPLVLKHSDVPGTEVIVADNASEDDSLSFLREHFPGVKIIELDKNHGFAGGYNLALDQIKAEYYVLLNSDIEVTPGWLQPLVNYLDNNHDIAAAMPKIKAFHQKKSFEYAGAAGGFIDKYGFTFCRGRIFNEIETDVGQYDTISDVFWASGACLFIRADVYHQMGGLDNQFFAHMEEIDLCWRIKNHGYRIACIPGSVVYHVGGGALPYQNPRKTFLNYRNNLLLLYKNVEKERLFRLLTLRIGLDLLSVFRFLLSGDFKNSRAIFKAHAAFRKLRPGYRKLRKQEGTINGNSKHPEIFNGSIVWRYFLKNQKKFSDLYK